jgi:soluble lytic murein transglycosylase-like protein
MKEQGWNILFFVLPLTIIVCCILAFDNYSLRNDRTYLEATLKRAVGLADSAGVLAEQALDSAAKYEAMFKVLKSQAIRDRLVLYMVKLRGPTPQDYEIAEAIIESCDRYGLPVEDGAALAKIESYFRPKEISFTGARGIMQLLPSTAKSLGVEKNRLFNIQENVDAGLKYYSMHLAKLGNAPDALRRYNGNSDPMFVEKWQSTRIAIRKRLIHE